MIQPGLIVIGDRRYIKADLIPIKISTSSAAESISILFAVYHIFNLSFPEHLNLMYNFLQNMVNFVEKETSQPPNKKKKSSSKSLVVNEFSMKILNQLSNQKQIVLCDSIWLPKFWIIKGFSIKSFERFHYVINIIFWYFILKLYDWNEKKI